MNKRLIPWYIFTHLLGFTCVGCYVVYEWFRHGLQVGLLLSLLSWSIYILAVPAAHGRLLVGSFFKMLAGISFFPEPYLWTFAVVLNTFFLLLAPDFYTHTLITYIFYRSLSMPAYWLIFALGAAGAWYRPVVGEELYNAKHALHTAIRHLLTLVGLLVLFYLTHQDFIVLINATVSG